MDLERMQRCCLKQRISKVLRSSLPSTCSITSRSVTDTVQEPVFVPRRYNQGNNKQDVQWLRRSVPPLPSDQQQRPLFTRRREMATSVVSRLPPDCGVCRTTAVTRKPGKKDRKKARRASEREGRKCLPASPVSSSCSYHCFELQNREELQREERRTAMKKKKKETVMEGDEKKKKKKLLSNSYGFTSSSSEDSENDDGEVLFGSDDTETLFSSRSFSSESSGFYYSSSCRCRRKKKATQLQRRRQKPGEEDGEKHSRRCSTGRDGFRPLVSISSSSSPSFSYLSGSTAKTHQDMEAEVTEKDEEMEARRTEPGFAVAKQSSDPREDFCSSMLEMIMENQVFEARELENLLLRYLSLNSRLHHPIILEVFSEIQNTLFGF